MIGERSSTAVRPVTIESECSGMGASPPVSIRDIVYSEEDQLLRAGIAVLKEENASLRERVAAFERLQAAGDSSAKDEADQVRRALRRMEVERDILLEGAAILRETAAAYAPVVANASRLKDTIYKVMRSPEEMQSEIDRRLADPKRTWWNNPTQRNPGSGR